MDQKERDLKKKLGSICAGDLICVEWCDASTGKSSLNGGMIDVPVKSWGVYLGLMGDRIEQIILAQNSFRFTNSIFDLDYTAIPVDMATEVQCILPHHLSKEIVNNLLRSFASDNNHRKSTGGLRSPRIFHHKIQQRLSINGKPD